MAYVFEKWAWYCEYLFISFLLYYQYYCLSVVGGLVCLEYPGKHSMLHQGLDYIVYSIDFYCITVILKI